MAARSRGIYDKMRLKFADSYGALPAGDWTEVPMVQAATGAERGHTQDPVLGLGRARPDPLPDMQRVNPTATLPVDKRAIGHWLKAAFGPPLTSTRRATGSIAFSGQPAAGSTITLGGVAWTFVAGAPDPGETQIGADLAATLAALAADLNGSADATVDDCIYAATLTTLSVERKAPGAAGNAFALAAAAASNGTVSGATLRGGGYRHQWSGEGPRARGSFAVSGQPANNATVTLGGTVWTFVAGAPGANQTKILGDLASTLAQLAKDLNASGNAAVARARYANEAASLTVELKEPDLQAAFSLAASGAPASNAVPSAAVLALAEELPDFAQELADPRAGIYDVQTGVKVNTLAFEHGRANPVNFRAGMIAKKSADDGASKAGNPVATALSRFLYFHGSILIDGVALGVGTSMQLDYSNALEPFDPVQESETIERIDEGVAATGGRLTVRLSAEAKTKLRAAAKAKTPVAFQMGWASNPEEAIVFSIHRAFLPEPTHDIGGPGGIDMTFTFDGAKDATLARSLGVSLDNDVSGY